MGQNQGAQAPPSPARLAQIVREYWQDYLKDDIYEKLRVGSQIDALPDLSEKYNASKATFAQHILAELTDIKPAELSQEDLLTLQILQWKERDTIDGAKFYWLPFQITPYTSLLPLVQRVYTEHRFRNGKDLAHYIMMLGKFPEFIDEMKRYLLGQAERGIVVPRDEIPVITVFLSSYVREPEMSPFFVEKARLGSLESGSIRPFQDKLVQIIRTQVNPTLRALIEYVKGEYAKRAPAEVGLWQYPRGKDFYRYLVHYHTTLDISPEEIHQIGLDCVEKAEARMAEIRRSMGFQGEPDEFNRLLKSNPQFYVKTPEEVEARLMSYVSRVEKVVNSYFRQMPKASYAVKRLDPSLEGGQTFGHYEPPSATQPLGIYFFNGSHLSERSLFQAGPLIMHELIPGHHFQIALQVENQSLPEFRRESWFTAYVEGWGDYASKLGQEMGIFKDPYDLYALQAMDIFMSVRLVVDTGLNYLGWSRAKALAFMKQHTLASETEIRSESLRYSVDMPAQALAYKMGSKEILELREKAKQSLGDKFDKRNFHDCILASGAMPLSILAKHVDWCVQQVKATAGIAVSGKIEPGTQAQDGGIVP
jgi:uncharacterized protein (DUF885 family)